MAKVRLIKFYLILLVISVLSLSFVSAETHHIFTGTVTIGSNTSTTGAFVAAYINGVMKANCTVGKNCGEGLATDYSYFFDVTGGNNGDAIVLTIYNVTANNTYTFATSSITPVNLTMRQSADNAACSWSSACSGGYCCSGATEYHGNGVGACQSSECVAPPTTTPGGGGGGGGASTPGEESQTKYTGLIQPGATKEVEYTKHDTLKITSISVTTTKQVTNAGIKVAESSASAAGYAITSDEGGAYKYLKITKMLISDDQIASVKIYFKVDKSWYTTNDYDPATTKMRRNVDDAWQDLATTKYKEDETYYYFYADSPGLSYFAITAQKKGYVPVVPEEEAVCGDGVCEYGETCSSCLDDCACGSDEECINDVCTEIPSKPTITERKLLWLWIALGIVFLAGIIVFFFMVNAKKKQNK